MTDVVTHAEVVRSQKKLEHLQAEIQAAQLAIADVRNVAAGSVIKKIQRGTIKILSNTSEASVTVSEVDISKSIINFLGAGIYMPGETGYALSAMIELKNSTTVRASKTYDGYSIGEIPVSFELVEYY